MVQKQAKLSPVLILVASQFDEEFVVRCVCQMRQKNIEVLLVGLYPGPVIGTHGVWLRPDCSLADIETMSDYQLVPMLILPGPQDCTMKLLFNPRVHELIEMTFKDEGCVAAVSTKTRDLLMRSGLAVPENEHCFLFQGYRKTGEFVKQLVTQMGFLSERIIR
jgi:hypothetical protein